MTAPLYSESFILELRLWSKTNPFVNSCKFTPDKASLTCFYKNGRISLNNGPVWKIRNLAYSWERPRPAQSDRGVARDATHAIASRARVTLFTQITLVTVNQRRRAPGFVATQVAICYLLNGWVDFAHSRQADWYGQVVPTCQKSAPSDKWGELWENIPFFIKTNPFPWKRTSQAGFRAHPRPPCQVWCP